MREISAIGCSVPSSLLACITETRTVEERSARRISSGSTTPLDPTRTYVTVDALPLQLRARIQHRGMLDSGRNHVPLRPLRVTHDAEERKIIRLRAAADEHDLLRLAADERGRLPTRHLQALLGHLPEMMDTGRVAIHFGETPDHRLDDFRRDGRCRVMIEVVTLHFLLV